ncbi:MAG: serine/threonine protein kinase [Myxococcales bacterium]|nr:serine/threonine protein kinase [Myxococcales bacterium]
MEDDDLKQDLLFCRSCGRHYRGGRRQCPHDHNRLEVVQPFVGQTDDVIDDRYVLGVQIGVGGMGTVWRAWDRLTKRDVALKVLNARYASHAASARRFLTEARMMRTVRHPSAVQLHRFGPTRDGHLLIDMEYVAGETVRDRVVNAGRGLPIDAGMRIIDGVLAALAACHSAEVVHCDIKPENVMLTESNRCKLLDFGIAQKPGPIEQGDDVVVLGTPAFMSPEQVRGVDVDCRTDLYLLGCLAYEIWTGQPPFTSQQPLALCHAQLLEQPPTLSSRLAGTPLPDGLEQWLLTLLAKDPAMRPKSARTAREQLRVIRRGKTPALTPPSRTRFARTAEVLHHARSQAVAAAPAVAKAASQKGGVGTLRCLVEARQVFTGGTVYGPKAIEEILGHVACGFVQDMKDAGGHVSGPDGALIEILLDTDGDERGAISHLLDCLAELNARLERIPEPELEVRAAVRAVPPGVPLHSRPSHDLLGLLSIGPGSQVRVDEQVARWAGRRPIVRLGSVRESGGSDLTTLYATSLQPS